MKFVTDGAKRPDKIDKIIDAVNTFASSSDGFLFCTQEGSFYMWINNYWQVVHDLVFEKWMMDNNEPFLYMSKSKRGEAMHNLALIKQKDLKEFNKGEHLDLNNGVYMIGAGKFGPHDKRLMSSIRIPYNYEPQATCEGWLAFLNDCLEGVESRVALLQEYMGYCLGKDNSFHRALILIGDGRNGKGTTFHIIKKMLGENNCTALKLGQMCNENFAARLASKLVNIDADTDTGAANYETDFRRITAGDTIMVKNLYSDPYELTPYVRLLIGANELPHIADKTHGLYDRILIIPYNVSYAGREDFGLKDRLSLEISGILNWAIEGRRRLYGRGRFTETDEMVSMIKELKRLNNPIQAYIDERIVINIKSEVKKEDLYADYLLWCRNNGYKALSHIKFSKELYRILKHYTKMDGRKTDEYTNYRIWPGIHITGKWEEVKKWE